MAKQLSALNGHYQMGEFINHASQDIDLSLSEVHITQLQQVAAYNTTIQDIIAHIKSQTGVDAPSANQVAQYANEPGKSASILRIEPLKWLILGDRINAPAIEQGCTLDLSHARTHLRINGPAAREFLNRHISLDLRENKFQIGQIATTVSYDIDVTIWRTESGFDLLVQRSFARHFWQILLQTAVQFNFRITAKV